MTDSITNILSSELFNLPPSTSSSHLDVIKYCSNKNNLLFTLPYYNELINYISSSSDKKEFISKYIIQIICIVDLKCKNVADINNYSIDIINTILLQDTNILLLCFNQLANIIDLSSKYAMEHQDVMLSHFYSLLTCINSINIQLPNELCFMHSKLILLAIKSKKYNEVINIINTPMLKLTVARTNVNVVDVLLYHYYSGICLCYCGKYKDATEMFLLAIITPESNALSAIQIESYKKYILCSLLAGLPCSLPRNIDRAVSNKLTEYSGLYERIAVAFGLDMKGLIIAIQDAEKELKKDNNLSLACKLNVAFAKELVLKKLKPYARLHMSALSQMTSFNENDLFNIIGELCSNHRLNATINNSIIEIHEMSENEVVSIIEEKKKSLSVYMYNLKELQFELNYDSKQKGIDHKPTTSVDFTRFSDF